MKETIVFKDIIGTHTIQGEIIEDKGMYITIFDGKNELYIHKRQIQERIKNNKQVSLNCFV